MNQQASCTLPLIEKLMLYCAAEHINEASSQGVLLKGSCGAQRRDRAFVRINEVCKAAAPWPGTTQQQPPLDSPDTRKAPAHGASALHDHIDSAVPAVQVQTSASHDENDIDPHISANAHRRDGDFDGGRTRART